MYFLQTPRWFICRLLITAAVTWGVPTSALHAQVISGRVLDERGTAVERAVIRLLSVTGDTLGTATTDSIGGFVIRLREPGRVRLRIERRGHETRTTQPVSVEPGAHVRTDVRISDAAIILPGVEAVASEAPPAAVVTEFERRRRMGEAAGHGKFLDRMQLARHWRSPVSDVVLQTQFLPHIYDEKGNFHVGTADCPGAVFYNGVRMDLTQEPFTFDDVLRTENIEALEIYTRNHVPAEFRSGFGPCTAVVAWGRVGRSDPGRDSRTRILVGLGVMMSLFALMLLH